MQKLFLRLSSISQFALYAIAALFFVWRGQLFVMFGGGAFVLVVRAMCGLLAVLLVLLAFIELVKDDEPAEWTN